MQGTEAGEQGLEKGNHEIISGLLKLLYSLHEIGKITERI